MKNLIRIFGLLLFALSARAQSVEDITGALRQGKVEVLARYLDRNVEIAIPGKDDMVSKAEATEVLRKFFSNYHPRSFSEMHQGRSKGQDSQYIIGNLNTDKGSFRVYIYMKSQNGSFAIQEIRFDKE